jgi:hypothetical protein
MINFKISIPDECLVRDDELNSSSNMYTYYKLIPYGDYFCSKASHLKEIWHDGDEYYEYELGSFQNGKWELFFSWMSDDEGIF